MRGVWEGKIREVRRVWESAEGCNGLERRRKVPDWCVDDITFSVMLDPVVVCSILVLRTLVRPVTLCQLRFDSVANENRLRQANPMIAPR